MTERVLRIAIAAGLMSAGVLTFAASWQRWANACGWRDFDTRACLIRQDHLYDFEAPIGPWESIGDAALLQGLAYGCLAAVLLVAPLTLLPRYRLGGLVSGLVLSLPVVALAAGGVASAAAGEAVTFVGQRPIVILVAALAPLWLFALALLTIDRATGRAPWGDAGIFVLLALATPMGVFVLAPLLIGYSSHDTVPWSEAVGGVLWIVAGGLAMVSAVRRPGAVAPHRAAAVAPRIVTSG